MVPRAHARRRRRDRVQRHRHGPGPEGRSHRAACTRPSSRPRPTDWASDCRLCRSIIESHRGRIRAQNLYNGDTAVGLPFRLHAARRNPAHESDQRLATAIDISRAPHEPDPEKRHRLCRRRRRGGARLAAMAARRQGLPRQVLRLRRVVPVALRPARGRLPDRRHPHGRHERPGAAGPPDRAPARRCRSSSSPATATCRWRSRR